MYDITFYTFITTLETMRTKILFLFFISTLYTSNSFSQATSVAISLDGSINNFVTHSKLFGVTIYMMQNGKTIAKSVTDNFGNYSISGKVIIQEPIDLLISKPGYISKKVLFDIATLKINKNRADATTLELVEELVIELYELRQGVDLSFAKMGYAEKFTWDQPTFIVKPDTKSKEDLDKKVLEAYEKGATSNASKKYNVLAEQANNKKDYAKALAYYDSALVVSPKDTLIIKNRANTNLNLQTQKAEEVKRKDYIIFKEAGDAAFKSGNFPLAESKYAEAAKLYPTEQYIKDQVQKISLEKQKEADNTKNKASYEKAIQEANSFVTAKKYDEAITKFTQALSFQPNQKAYIDSEIAKLKGGQSDVALEEMVKKDLKTAVELLNKSKLDEAIKTYRATEPIISRFSNQTLIDKYSKEVKEGILNVQAKKDTEDQLYKAQLAKAQENFDKGKDFYSVAKNILNVYPMKSKVNEPEVLELKDKINRMEAYYQEKQKAYKSVLDKKNEEALENLNNTIRNYVITKKIAPVTEKAQLQKSIDSLSAYVKTKSVAPPTTTPITPTVSKVKLTAPGELVTGKDPSLTAYNDMFVTTERTKKQPLAYQENVKDNVDYNNYFNAKLVEARQEEEKNRVLDYANKSEMIQKEVRSDAIKTQYLQEDVKLKAEKEVERKNAESKLLQEDLSKNIDNWKDKSDYLKIETDKKIQEQYINQIATIDRNKSQNQLVKEGVYTDLIARQDQQQSKIENIQYANFKKDSIERHNQEARSNQVQVLMDYTDTRVLTANNLEDENGVPFEKNKMTERVYKIKNADDYVIKVIVRRVVVDKNGFGVVYEQITNDVGFNSYTKNGAQVPDFIWFNESTGENVIEK
jgi:hypothetical protein